jgi:hypothetical protein
MLYDKGLKPCYLPRFWVSHFILDGTAGQCVYLNRFKRRAKGTFNDSVYPRCVPVRYKLYFGSYTILLMELK